jgi:hypothetical protein
MGFMKAALGVRFFPDDDLRRLLFRPAFLAAPLRADLRDEDFFEDLRDEDFRPPLFFFVAILSPGW